MDNEVQNEVVQNTTAQTTNSAPIEKKGFSIASMILGIVAILALCLNGYVSIICAILAIVFAIIGKKKGAKGMAITGLVLGIIALAIYALLILLGVGIASAAIAAM